MIAGDGTLARTVWHCGTRDGGVSRLTPLPGTRPGMGHHRDPLPASATGKIRWDGVGRDRRDGTPAWMDPARAAENESGALRDRVHSPVHIDRRDAHGARDFRAEPARALEVARFESARLTAAVNRPRLGLPESGLSGRRRAVVERLKTPESLSVRPNVLAVLRAPDPAGGPKTSRQAAVAC